MTLKKVYWQVTIQSFQENEVFLSQVSTVILGVQDSSVTLKSLQRSGSKSRVKHSQMNIHVWLKQFWIILWKHLKLWMTHFLYSIKTFSIRFILQFSKSAGLKWVTKILLFLEVINRYLTNLQCQWCPVHPSFRALIISYLLLFSYIRD